MHIETRRFPPPYDRCSSGTTKSGIGCLRRYDVPAHRQDRVDPLHSFNPFILFTGPDEVFGTHKIGLLVEIPDTVTLLLLRNLQGQIDALEARLDAIETP